MTLFILAPFTGDHDVDKFNCGNTDLNDWLKRHALASHRADLARTYLVIAGPTVAGYVSLTTGSIRPDDAPKRMARGMPRYPIGTILIARLAIDERYQGQGLGSRLLGEALHRAVATSDAAASRLVVVDAIGHDAVDFYTHRGFVSTPDNPMHLFRKMSEIRASLPAAD